jgi:hypothetical protein
MLTNGWAMLREVLPQRRSSSSGRMLKWSWMECWREGRERRCKSFDFILRIKKITTISLIILNDTTKWCIVILKILKYRGSGSVDGDK